jgi:hypothetical protein
MTDENNKIWMGILFGLLVGFGLGTIFQNGYLKSKLKDEGIPVTLSRQNASNLVNRLNFQLGSTNPNISCALVYEPVLTNNNRMYYQPIVR